MKSFNKLIALLIVVTFTMISCSDDPIIQPVTYGIKANFGEAFNNQSTAGIQVKLKSINSTDEYISTTDTEGNVNFDAVNPGTYNLTATASFTSNEYKNFFGVATTETTVNFSGTLDNIVINNSSDMNKTVVLKTSKIGDLLIKQVYYAGSDIFNSASFRDLFFELYNNSNEVIYLDGLHFAQVYGRTTSSVKTYTLTNGQFDWTKSIDQTKGDKSNTDYTYADHIIKFPGTGKQYPLNPGESTVVAGTAINHKQPLVTPTKTYQVAKPELTIDLSGANFEVNFVDYFNSIGKTPLSTDIDNPSVQNMDIVYNNYQRELILDPSGRDSFVIFRIDDFNTLNKIPNPQTTNITSKTRKFVQIPNNIIIDGVEVRKADAAKAAPRRLDSSIDAGQMFVPKGQYSSQSIIRKVAQTFGTRKVLQDTNNSENDFIAIDIPVPGGWN
ncbi:MULTISPECIES: DUF4876 domain-containing protein [unclassified Tenacibaculum]|uniref:DUF4876 domain-containing protein n=1 Tax=unclassified Tenacibaculum TaxID=2635139 RepID=UPI001F415C73|nr:MULTISPECIES: DUF4876 domain-containing protein [unclassified Tenacibaculum]MCF2876576.1 DUF4876 domain-containing protein [Tenacibaculum sp. Cn5-1]MCF2936727.1 DUF4876 domain-containing protein [Tenacibaculum sp. Cn5-34]MCG7512951.1 DUF4876 domain-containing protein [Tenacibaculum sp. Cn5-46]